MWGGHSCPPGLVDVAFAVVLPGLVGGKASGRKGTAMLGLIGEVKIKSNINGGGPVCPPHRGILNRVRSLWHHLLMPQIQIPTPLRQYAGKQATVDVSAKSVGEALTSLIAQHPELKRHLYTDDGTLRAFVNVYVNDEDMRYLQKEATALKDGDTISIVPSIAGGC